MTDDGVAKFVYHQVPREMVGDAILPLSQLAAIAPALYEFQRGKYVGREAAMEFRIPHLDVLLNDAVHCAAVHPHRLFAARRALGLNPPSRPQGGWATGLFFPIPLERILPNRAVWYSAETLWINGAPNEPVPLTPPAAEFEPFDPARYQELADVTTRHLAYLRHMRAHGRRPLMFVHIPHVFVDGPINVRGLKPIRWDMPTNTEDR